MKRSEEAEENEIERLFNGDISKFEFDSWKTKRGSDIYDNLQILRKNEGV